MVNIEIRLIILLAAKDWRNSIQSAKQNWELSVAQILNAKFRLKLKKVGKITRSFINDLNQIPYDYTMEGTNRFKGFNLIDRVPEELWTEVLNIVQEAVIKTSPKKNTRWLS